MDGLLRMVMPEGIIPVGHVDNTAVIVVAPNLETARIKTDDLMRRVARWMEEYELQCSSRENGNSNTGIKIVPIRVGK